MPVTSCSSINKKANFAGHVIITTIISEMKPVPCPKTGLVGLTLSLSFSDKMNLFKHCTVTYQKARPQAMYTSICGSALLHLVTNNNQEKMPHHRVHAKRETGANQLTPQRQVREQRPHHGTEPNTTHKTANKK